MLEVLDRANEWHSNQITQDLIDTDPSVRISGVRRHGRQLMNWEAIGAIGETVGAIAVVITLLYLASQTKQNTKATHAQATASVAAEMETNLLAIANNGDLAEAYRKAQYREKLLEIEAVRLGFWWAAFVRSAHSHLIQDGLGNLSEDNENAVSQILGSFMTIPFLTNRLQILVDAGMYPEDFCVWLTENVLPAQTEKATSSRLD